MDRSVQAIVVALELLQQRCRRLDGHAEQRRLQLLERMRARRHLYVEPAGRILESPAPQGRNEAGAYGRRFPAPRGAHDREEPGSLDVIVEPLDESLDQRLAAEEVPGVGLDERTEPLERVRRVGRGCTHFCGRTDRVAERRGERRGIGEAERRILLRRMGDDVVDRGRKLRSRFPDGRERIVEVLLEERGDRTIREGLRPVSASKISTPRANPSV